ncbi:hypothetical protein BGW38_010031 [Lunasporangiospora selenospora]|uniref:D-xylose 1-dehydrogenase (NADP(+), D-xylono-1,5-lactone-forming) n=1 Tax=Lunasporangiospora selenospora TaxID=979761 RepID=A0A9P6FXC9_9FUNG|nr:hypothetical protein BGW38_010031 [Lunasporangiospora selenospora]
MTTPTVVPSAESPNLWGRINLAKPKTAVPKAPNALRIGQLSAAKIAPASLLNPAKTLDNVEVVALAARDVTKAEEYAKLHGIPRTYTSYEALLADPEIDAVYIPLPNGLHHVWTKKAILAGKHVLLEKPAASNATQTADLVQLAKEKGIVLLEAFHYRFHPAGIYFQQIIREHVNLHGGDPRAVIKGIHTEISLPKIIGDDDIRFNWDLAGGALMDLGTYTVNAIHYFTGLDIDSVDSAEATTIPKDDRVDGKARATLTLKGTDAKAELVVSLVQPLLSFSSWWNLFPNVEVETEDKVFTFTMFALPHVYHTINILDKRTGKKEETIKAYQEGYSTYRYQLEAFVRAVKEKDGVEASKSTWVSGADSIETQRVIDEIYKKAGLPVRE